MRSRTSHRRTPRTAQRRVAAVALAGVAALIATAVQSGAAVAAPGTQARTASAAAPGSESVNLTPAQRAALMRQADSVKAETAKDIGLGAKEKLVVRDVLKDSDGTVHVRYERTYDGLPVLGGDLIVQGDSAGDADKVVKATRKPVKPATTAAKVPAAKAEAQALSAAKAEKAEGADVDRAPRKVIWAASGTPVVAYETVVGGLQHDGTPREVQVVTDATTGAQLSESQAGQTGTGADVAHGRGLRDGLGQDRRVEDVAVPELRGLAGADQAPDHALGGEEVGVADSQVEALGREHPPCRSGNGGWSRHGAGGPARPPGFT